MTTGGRLEAPATRSAGNIPWAGLTMLLISVLVAALERSAGGAPASVAVWLLVIGAWGVLLVPASGFWLFAVPAAIVLVRRRRRAGT